MRDSRRSLAHVSALLGRYDEAIEWFNKARVALDEKGARPLRAIVDYDEALMYVRRGGPGDTKRAAPLLEAALAQFRDIGMTGWIRCAEHLLREGRELRPGQQAEEATAAADLGHAERLHHEIESLTEQLTAAYGLGGRARTTGDPAERVRKAVTNQIRRALERISVAHPELGRHLANALRTGFACTYRPEHRVAWRL